MIDYMILIGGHAISGIGGVALLIPISKKIEGRFQLAIACLMVPLSIPYMLIFDLYTSGKYVFASIPPLVSLIMLIYYFKLVFPLMRRMTIEQITIAVVLIISITWAHYFNIFSAHGCFMGACC